MLRYSQTNFAIFFVRNYARSHCLLQTKINGLRKRKRGLDFFVSFYAHSRCSQNANFKIVNGVKQVFASSKSSDFPHKSSVSSLSLHFYTVSPPSLLNVNQRTSMTTRLSYTTFSCYALICDSTQ